MGLILIVIGAVAGWRAGQLHASAYGILAFGAAFAAGLMLLLGSGRVAPLDATTFLIGWLVSFLYLAIPYSALAWLKAKRIENRGE